MSTWEEVYSIVRTRSEGRCENRKTTGRCVEIHGEQAINYNGKVVLTPYHLGMSMVNLETKIKMFCMKCSMEHDMYKITNTKKRKPKIDLDQVDLFK